MESPFSWEYNALINELTQGMEKANQLRVHLYSSEGPNLLLQNVLASYENALFILKKSELVVQAKPVATISDVTEPSVSINGSPKSQQGKKNVKERQVDKISPKKRKMKNTWTDEMQVMSDNGLEGPKDDGYSWRKYGQKDILGAKYPRSYYRCTYRLLQNCCALKQVQRSDDDPTIFDVKYKGAHTCHQANYTFSRQASPEKHELKHDSYNPQSQEQNNTLFNLKANLRVNTNDLDSKDASPNMSFPSTFTHQEHEHGYHTSESEYFLAEMYQMMINDEAPILQHSESGISEIISAHASTNNSPIGGMEFPFDHADLDPNFSLYHQGTYRSFKLH